MAYSHHQNYYELLEVDPSSSLHKIREAYIRAKKTYSPNSPALYSMFSETEARQLLKLIEEAYHILSNQAKRIDYDLRLQNKNSKTLSRVSLINDPTLVKNTLIPIPNQVPEGFAKSKFSVYEILPEIEEQIASESVLDGKFIQKIRMYKNINLEQMSAETRISRSYLVAIESNDFESLPAAVFVRGFVVQISKVLDLNPEKVAKAYMNYFKQGYVGKN